MPVLRSRQHQTHPRLLVIDEVAEILRVSPSQIYKLTARGQMPEPIRLGGVNRWDHQALTKWIEAGCPPAGRPTESEVAK